MGSPSGAGQGARHGTVVDFDEQRGTGTLAEPSGAIHFFHCTAITDGTRRIEVGAPVTFEVVAGHLGRWEAACVQPRGS